MSNLSLDYEILVAAFALRDPEFIGEYGRLLKRVSQDFFGFYALPDIVQHGLSYYFEHGQMLPAEALKADMAMVGRDGIARDTYHEVIDRIFDCDLKGRKHVEDTIIEQSRMRLLIALGDPTNWIMQGQYKEYLNKVKEIEGIGRTRTDSVVALADDFDVLVHTPRQGIPLGYERIDSALSGGGPCSGELCLILGRYNVGKSQLLGNVTVNGARWMLEQDEPGLIFFVSFETSLRNTRTRLAKIALGWTDQMIRDNPKGFLTLVQEQLVPLPIFVKFTAGPEYDFAALERDMRAAEDRTGRKVMMVVRDYGELMADDPDDYRSVRRSYKGFKDFCTKHEIAGMDACQKNRNGKISHFNLLKDADILLDLDKPQSSDSQLVCRIERNREGPAGVNALLRVDRHTGVITTHTMRIEDIDEDELKSDSRSQANPGDDDE